jgi:hypothetical protein
MAEGAVESADVSTATGSAGKGAELQKSQTAADADQRPNPASAASLLGSVAFLCLLVFLSYIAWQSHKLTLNAAAPSIVTALLGAVLNPPKGEQKISAMPPLGTALWFVLVAVALAAGIFTGVMTLKTGHPNATEAFAACVAGLAGLFYDTSNYSVVEKALAGKSKAA